LYQKQRFETDKTPEQVWELLQSSNQSIEQELRKSFLSRMGGFKVRLDRVRGELRICRLNPFWDHTILKISQGANGSVLEVESIPQPFYDYAFLSLLTILLIMVAWSTRAVAFLLIVYAAIILVALVNLATKYRNFDILTAFCQKRLL